MSSPECIQQVRRHGCASAHTSWLGESFAADNRLCISHPFLALIGDRAIMVLENSGSEIYDMASIKGFIDCCCF
jgi:hypothetical protein